MATKTKDDDISLFDLSKPKPEDISLSRNILNANKRAYESDSKRTRRRRWKKVAVKRQQRVIAKGAPKAPTNFQAAPSDSECIQLNWDDPQNKFLTYTIEKRSTGDGHHSKWTALKSGLAGSQYVDKNCFAGQLYYYRIFATDEDGLDGHTSKQTKASSYAGLGSFKKLWNKANAEADEIQADTTLTAYERFIRLFHNLCWRKTLQAVRKKDKDTTERESRGAMVFIETMQAAEERLIKNAFAAFDELDSIPKYLHCREAPKNDFNADAEELRLRPVALKEAFTAFDSSGDDLLRQMEGYIYSTATKKLIDVKASDKNINNECEHKSNAERAARQADHSKPQPFTIRVDSESLLNGSVQITPGFDDALRAVCHETGLPLDGTTLALGHNAVAAEASSVSTGWQPPTYTPEQKAAYAKFMGDSEEKERGIKKALAGSMSGYRDSGNTQEDSDGVGQPLSHNAYMPDNAVTPDIADTIPSLITSSKDWATATPNDVAVTVEAIADLLPQKDVALLDEVYFQDKTEAELAAKYEGASNAAAIKRIHRRKQAVIADAGRRLTSHALPVRPMAVPLHELLNYKG